MATQGPNITGTGADDATVGTLTWSNPTRITADDGSYATISNAAAATSHYIKATNFGFTIPAGATINGISVLMQRRRSGTGTLIQDTNVRIVKGGSISSTNLSAGAIWPGLDEDKVFGSSSELWGETWTAADINSSTFGVVVSWTKPSAGKTNSTAMVDYVSMTIDYTDSSIVWYAALV